MGKKKGNKYEKKEYNEKWTIKKKEKGINAKKKKEKKEKERKL